MVGKGGATAKKPPHRPEWPCIARAWLCIVERGSRTQETNLGRDFLPVHVEFAVTNMPTHPPTPDVGPALAHDPNFGALRQLWLWASGSRLRQRRKGHHPGRRRSRCGGASVQRLVVAECLDRTDPRPVGNTSASSRFADSSRGGWATALHFPFHICDCMTTFQIEDNLYGAQHNPQNSSQKQPRPRLTTMTKKPPNSRECFY